MSWYWKHLSVWSCMNYRLLVWVNDSKSWWQSLIYFPSRTLALRARHVLAQSHTSPVLALYPCIASACLSCPCQSVCSFVCKQPNHPCSSSRYQCMKARIEDDDSINGNGNRSCVVWGKSEKWFVWWCWRWWSSQRWRGGERGGGGGVVGINTVMESEWEGARGGRSTEMIPLSNPLDTRSVWLPTGSERESETEAGGGRTQRNQVGRSKNKMKGREERKAASHKARWEKRRERKRGRRTGETRDSHTVSGREKETAEEEEEEECDAPALLCLNQTRREGRSNKERRRRNLLTK